MSVVLRCWLTPTARDTGDTSLGFLKAFDPEAAGIPGVHPTGEAIFTEHVGEAMRFKSRGAAFDYWRQRSKTCPHRPDGEPNRPLTTFSIEMIEL